MRRITKWSLDEARRDRFFAGTKLTTIATRDYRLMSAVVRAADEWWSVGGNRVAAERLLAEAVDGFNAPEKRK